MPENSDLQMVKLPRIMEPSVAAGFPLVKGRCPSCGLAHLFLAVGGYVTCGNIKCPQPDLAHDLLAKGPE
jgi:hypothetical protein